MDKKNVLHKLKRLRYTCWFRTNGLCFYLGSFGVPYYEWSKHFQSWEHYSSSKMFPVPHRKYSTHVAFDKAIFKFNPLTEYGRKRYNLLKHIIREFEREIENEEKIEAQK